MALLFNQIQGLDLEVKLGKQKQELRDALDEQ